MTLEWVKTSRSKWLLGVSVASLMILGACTEQNSASEEAADDPAPAATESDEQAPTDTQNDETADESRYGSVEAFEQASSGVDLDPEIEAKIDALLAELTIEEKVGQTIQGDIASITPADVKEYRLGSILAGGGSAPGGDLRAGPQPWLDLADAFWQAMKDTPEGRPYIPIIFGVDAVHGHNNVVGATVFPHNIGLGAARDPDLIRRIGEVTATEMSVTGIDWTFAPTVAVVRDDRWGRTYESYSEDPAIVAEYAPQVVVGLQGEPGAEDFLGDGKIVSTTKHYVGDGGTTNGVDQGDTAISAEELSTIHAAGYPPAIEAGVRSVMASFNSWNGEKLHGHKFMLTDVLRDRYNFNGFVVGDWNGHGQVKGCTPTDCAQSINAGLDMFMAPDSWKGLYETTVAQVKDGTISMERLDEAVRTILRVKFEAGLFEKPKPSERALAGDFDKLGSGEHRAVAREAVRKSLVLLKNTGALPVAASANVLVAGSGASNMGKQTGGWTLSWQGTGNSREHFPNGDTVYEGIAAAVAEGGGTATLSEDGSVEGTPDVAIVVFGEDPYAEFQGDRPNLVYGNGSDLALIQSLKDKGIPVVSVFLSGRPMWVNKHLNASDAFVAAWLPGTEGGGIADVLIGDADGAARHDFHGKLSFSWPNDATGTPLNVGDADYDPLFAYGYGLTYEDDGDIGEVSEDSGIATATAAQGVYFEEGAAPGSWKLSLVANGELAELQSSGTTTLGALSVSWVDRAKQEDAMALKWDGSGDAGLMVWGDSVDLTREANGDLTLAVDYRLDAALEGGLTLGMGCGMQCGGGVDVSGLASAPVGEWATMKVRLSCFAGAGLDLTNVSAPFYMSSKDAAQVSLSHIRLSSADGAGECPATVASE